MKDIETLIGYTFRDKALLERALTHPSYSHIHKVENYQRLEFLGDSILDFIIADELCKSYPDLDEGKLTEKRKAIVAKTPLANVVKASGYDKYLKIGSGDLSDKMRSDLFEAICGAIYRDGGIEKAREFIVKDLQELIINAEDNDFKSALLIKYSERNVIFKEVGKTGADHHPTFFIELYIDGKLEASADGESKVAAEQKCAEKFLKNNK